MEIKGYIFLALSLLLALGMTGQGFAANAHPAEWSDSMNLSGNSAVFEVSAEQGEKLSADVATPLNLSGDSVRQQWIVPMNLSGDSVDSISEFLVEFCQDVAIPLNLSGNSLRQQWSVPMNLSGDSTLSLFEIFEELFSVVDSPLNLSGNSVREQWSVPMNLSGDSSPSLSETFEELTSQVDTPLNLSGNSVREQWIVPMNLSGNSAPSLLEVLEEICQDVGSPLNLSGNSVRQQWRVPMNLSGDSTLSPGVFADFSKDVSSPFSLSGDSVKHHLGGNMENSSVSETADGEKLNPELLPGFDLFNKMSRDGVLAQCVNDVIPNPPVIVNQIIPVDTQVTFELEDIDPVNLHQRYKCYFLLQDNYPRYVSAVVWADETHGVSSFDCIHCDYQIYNDGLYIFFKGQLIKIQDWQPL